MTHRPRRDLKHAADGDDRPYMGGVRSGCLRLSAVLVRHGLISARDAERVRSLRARGRTTPGGESSESVSPARRPAFSHTPDPRDYVCFLPTRAGYRLVSGRGRLPRLGGVLTLEHHVYEVTKIGRSPLPDDQRPCIYLDSRQPGADAP